MEKARCNTELYSNLRAPLNNVKPSNFWGSHHFLVTLFIVSDKERLVLMSRSEQVENHLDRIEGRERNFNEKSVPVAHSTIP